MKRLLLLCFPILISTTLLAQQDQQAAMKAWQDYMTPGEVHKMLAHADGDWTYEATMWMDPGAPPVKSTGTTINKMILGGRYQESIHKGNFSGMPFEGHSLLAFDNAKKIFQNAWIDNMGTGIMILEGPFVPGSHSLTLTGKTVDPMTGKDITIKQVYTIDDDNHHTLLQFCDKDGTETKNMEIKFTRK